MRRTVQCDVDPRPVYTEMSDMIEEGLINPKDLADELMRWLSESELEEFCRYYDYLEDRTIIPVVDVRADQLKVGDCVMDQEYDIDYVVTNIRKGVMGVYVVTFDGGSTAYYDADDKVTIKERM